MTYDVEREAYLQRVADMDYARPGYAKRPRELAEDHPYLDARTIEAIQLHAFEDGEEEEWWLVIPTAEEWAALAGAEGEGLGATPEDGVTSPEEGDGSCDTEIGR